MEGYLTNQPSSPEQAPVPNAGPGQTPIQEAPPDQDRHTNKLAENAMKVMYSDDMWPQVKESLGEGMEGAIDLMVTISVNILSMAKTKAFQFTMDDLGDAAMDLSDDIVTMGVSMGTMQGEPEDLQSVLVAGVLKGIAEKMPEAIDLNELQAIADQATPEEQQQAQLLMGG